MDPSLTLAQWPDSLDAVAVVAFLAGVVGLVALGYVLAVLDVRAYLRSLRRALVKVVRYLPEWPAWAQAHTPPALAAFGLRMPCTETDLRRAYRRRVKRLHPDRGGDKRRFLQLQAQFEEALAYLASCERTGRR
jgi:hypothetical protein